MHGGERAREREQEGREACSPCYKLLLSLTLRWHRGTQRSLRGEGWREGWLARRRGVESVLTSSLGGRGTGEPRGGACARASGAAAASDIEWSRRRSSGLRRGEKGKKIRQRGEWRRLRHVRYER
jgi:hypothetical protein